MKNKMKKVMALLSAAVLTVGVMGCGNSADNTSADANTQNQTDTTSQTTETQPSGDLSGKITLAGSTSMEKLCNAMAEAFMEKYPNVTVSPEFSHWQRERLISETHPVHYRMMRRQAER